MINHYQFYLMWNVEFNNQNLSCAYRWQQEIKTQKPNTKPKQNLFAYKKLDNINSCTQNISSEYKEKKT